MYFYPLTPPLMLFLKVTVQYILNTSKLLVFFFFYFPAFHGIINRIIINGGKIMEEIFAWKQDVWEDTLRRMGFFLGKFIYLLDAYDDVEEDIKNKNYNSFSEQYIIEGFDEQVRRILIMMMAQTCREFEKLPIIKYTDILRNILYSGVWCRFEVIHKKRKEAGEKDND